MDFNYQFEVCFIYKDKKWSKHLACRTFSSTANNYLIELLGTIISENDKVKDLNIAIEHIIHNPNNMLDGYLLSDHSGRGSIFIVGNSAKIIDDVHTNDGIVDGMQGPINYNISLPEEEQYIDKKALIGLLLEWRDFLLLQASTDFAHLNL